MPLKWRREVAIRPPVTLCILAGGRSSRFGRDKTVEPFFGEPIALRIAKLLSAFPEVIVVSKNPLKFPMQRVKEKHVVELYTGYLPVFGILTGLKAAKFEKVLFVPGDAPLVKPLFIREVSNQIPPAVITEGKKIHGTFCLLSKYHLPLVEEFLKEGGKRLKELHSFLGSKAVDSTRLKIYDFKLKTLINVNHKEDLIEAVDRLIG